MDCFRLAVVGCGIIAEGRHLPSLFRMPDRFSVTALCDTQPQALERGARWAPGARAYSNLSDLLAAAGEFDAAIVATSGDHVAETLELADRGKHLFIEKPLALTAHQARALVKAIDAARIHCSVGYMKRYTPPIMQMMSDLRGVGKVRFVRADLLHPPEEPYLRPLLARARPGSLHSLQSEVSRGRSASALDCELGSDASGSARVGHFLLATSAIHGVNLVRAVQGVDLEVVSACFWNRGLAGQATVASAGGAVADLVYAFVTSGSYSEILQVIGDDRRWTVRFPSPYLPHAPVHVQVEEPGQGELPQVRSWDCHDDPFQLELIAFHTQLSEGLPSLRST